MKVLISFINHKSEPQDPKRLVGIFDLKKKKLVKWLDLSICGQYEDVVHATGMCYKDDYLYARLPLMDRLCVEFCVVLQYFPEHLE